VFIGGYLVRMLEATLVQHGSVKILFLGGGVTLERQLNHEVNGIHLATATGKSTIPVDATKLGNGIEVKYMKGSGILYFVPTPEIVVMPRNHVSQEFRKSTIIDKSKILKILKDISEAKFRRTA
jgi:hypothetical protein